MFICSFYKYVLSVYYVPGTVLGTGNTAVNKIESPLLLYSLFNWFLFYLFIPLHFHVD